MNAASSASPPALCCFHDRRRRSSQPLPRQRRDLSPTHPLTLQISSSLFNPHRRRRRLRPPDPDHSNKPSTSERKIEVSIDVDDIAGRASATLTRLYRSSEARFDRFLTSGAEAYHDLRTSVWFDGGHRIMFSCRRSSLLFVANLFVWSLAAVVAVRALAWIGSGLWLRMVVGFGDRSVVRRDRSLAGREVVVGRRIKGREAEKTSIRALANPLSPARGTEMKLRESSGKRVVRKEELPKWWPDSVSSPVISVGKQEYQREADRLVRAIMDRRMSGEDFKDDDIIQLRRICKISGARISFETANARDSFYRASVNLVLNSCIRVRDPTATVLIDGEEARQFISGLAYNIGLENVHAARLVRAAVAARTRSSILQSWALEVQGRRSEALEELSKICQIHLIFPPEEYSPEIEMVANGLKKNLRVEQREHLLNLFRGVCGAENQRIAAEALGLMEFFQPEGNGDVTASSLR